MPVGLFSNTLQNWWFSRSETIFLRKIRIFCGIFHPANPVFWIYELNTAIFTWAGLEIWEFLGTGRVGVRGGRVGDRRVWEPPTNLSREQPFPPSRAPASCRTQQLPFKILQIRAPTNYNLQEHPQTPTFKSTQKLRLLNVYGKPCSQVVADCGAMLLIWCIMKDWL